MILPFVFSRVCVPFFWRFPYFLTYPFYLFLTSAILQLMSLPRCGVMGLEPRQSPPPVLAPLRQRTGLCSGGALRFIFVSQESSFYVLIVAFDLRIRRFHCTSAHLYKQKEKTSKGAQETQERGVGAPVPLDVCHRTTRARTPGLREGGNLTQSCRPSVSSTPQRVLHLLTQRLSD